MAVDIHIMDKSGLFSPAQRDRVLVMINDALANVGLCCAIPDLDIIVFPTENYDHPEGYHGGYAFGPNCFEVSINPSHKLFETRFEIEFPGLVLHELHHCLRFPHVKTWTVGELVLLEGLAKRAELAFGNEQLPLDSALPFSARLDLCQQALDKRNDHGHGNTVWVYARNSDEESPHLYLIGDMLVSAALQNLQMNAFQAVDAKADFLLNTGAEVLGLRV